MALTPRRRTVTLDCCGVNTGAEASCTARSSATADDFIIKMSSSSRTLLAVASGGPLTEPRLLTIPGPTA
jgi:hypothetical protein